MMKCEIIFKDNTAAKFEDECMSTEVKDGFYVIEYLDPKNEYRIAKRLRFNMQEIFSIDEQPYGK